MATTIDKIIQAGLEAADCEKSNNFSTTELLSYANESLSETYDEIVTAWEEYFQSSVTFDVDASQAVNLRTVTTGIPVPDPFPVTSLPSNPRVILAPGGPVFSASMASSLALQWFAVGGTSSLSTRPGALNPQAGRVLQVTITPSATIAAPTRWTLYKNGVATAASAFMSSGSSGSQTFLENSWGVPVHFEDGDVMDFAMQETSSPAAYSFEASTWMWLDQPDSLFYKEAGLIKQGCSDPIFPLDTYANRNDFNYRGPRYWIAGETLSLWPNFPGSASLAGTYTLDYVPNCPVLDYGQVIPPELERWKEIISVSIGIKCKTKREQDTTSLERRQVKLIEGITVARGKRKKEVRKMQPMRNWDQFPQWPWNGRGRPFGY